MPEADKPSIPLQEQHSSKETEKRPARAMLFDIDGVITDPKTKKVKQPKIIDDIIDTADAGEPVGGNTGRSLEFAGKQVLDLIEARIAERGLERDKVLKNIFVIGEKGGTELWYDEQGQSQERIDTTLYTPEFQKMQTEVEQLVQDRFTDIMFVDTTKRTMITVEMRELSEDEDVERDFRPRQKELVPQLEQLREKHKLEHAFNIDATEIATDIESPKMGKDEGGHSVI